MHIHGLFEQTKTDPVRPCAERSEPRGIMGRAKLEAVCLVFFKGKII